MSDNLSLTTPELILRLAVRLAPLNPQRFSSDKRSGLGCQLVITHP